MMPGGLMHTVMPRELTVQADCYVQPVLQDTYMYRRCHNLLAHGSGREEQAVA